MDTPQRNQLVWLTEAAWRSLLVRAWDAQAQSLLAHWQGQQLPWVVCRQRMPSLPGTISLGLPAPLQWQRRKLALEMRVTDIARTAHFSLLESSALTTQPGVPPLPTLHDTVQHLLRHMDALQVQLRVYGSFGWQQLSGLTCVREGSDLDLLAYVPDLGTAGQVVWLLQGLKLPWRVDGELVFPNGWALAWREYAQLIGGKTDRVLVKHRLGAELRGMAELRAQLRPGRDAAAPGALVPLP